MSDIYGTDDNKLAQSISRAALSRPSADKAGSASGSKGATPDAGDVKVINGIVSDTRAKSQGDCK